MQPLPQPKQATLVGDSSVELRDVRFQYPGSADEVLHGVSLHVPPRSMTALIGASGSGKSTVMRLIARFFDATQGEVLIAGVDVRDIGDAQLAAQAQANAAFLRTLDPAHAPNIEAHDARIRALFSN